METFWDNGGSAKAHEDAVITKIGANQYVKDGKGSATLTQAPGFVWPDTKTNEPRSVTLTYREAVTFVDDQTLQIYDLGSRDFAPGVSAIANARLWKIAGRTMSLTGPAPGNPGITRGTCSKQ